MSREAMALMPPSAGLPAGGFEDLHQDHAQDDGDDEQGQRDRGTAAELEELERDVEEVDRQDVGGVAGPPPVRTRIDVDEAEIVHEAQHDGDQQERDRDWAA